MERVTYRKDPLWVPFCPHVGVMDLFEDHPGLIVFTILGKFKHTDGLLAFISNIIMLHLEITNTVSFTASNICDLHLIFMLATWQNILSPGCAKADTFLRYKYSGKVADLQKEAGALRHGGESTNGCH